MSEYTRALRAKIGNTLLQVPTASVVTMDDQQRVLLARQAEGGQWTTPGGMVEPHELPAEAAVRETWEETGVLVELTHIIGVFGGPLCGITYGNGDRLSWVATVFGGRPIGGHPRPDGDETLEVRYVARDELRTLPCREHVRMFLDAAFTASDRAYFSPSTWRPDAM
ncbi:MAG: NUDIX domain-containing protein [Pseudomonadota bacterium]|nr:NUDIX domain-containing protein [Pseudomonadota bacterium]